MIQSYYDILSDIKAGKIAPLYFLSGEQEFFIDEISRFFEKEFLSDDERDFNQTILYGRDTGMSEITERAKRYPILAEKQVIVVKEAQDLSKRDWERLETYARNPIPTTVLVFCYKHGSLDKRFAVAKAMVKNGVWLEQPRMYDQDCKKWIVDHVKRLGYSIEDRAADMLFAFLGNDLSKLANEISKLLLLFPANKTITSELVSENIGISKNYNVFELQKSIAMRNMHACNDIIRYFNENPKQAPLEMLIGVLYSFYVKAIQAAQLPDKSTKQIMSALRVNFFAAQEYAAMIHNYSIGKLYASFSILREYDTRKKGLGASADSEGALIQEMVYKLTH